MEKLPKSKTVQTIYIRTLSKIYNVPTKSELKSCKNNIRTINGAFQAKKHLFIIKLKEEAICRFRQVRETAEHVLCYCRNISRIMFLELVEENPEAGSYVKEHLSRMWNLHRRIEKCYNRYTKVAIIQTKRPTPITIL